MSLEAKLSALASRISQEINAVRSDIPASSSGSLSMIWAEENSSLNPATNSGFQFSFGNGATSINGITLPLPGTVVGLSISSNGDITGGVIELYKNGIATGQTITITGAAKAHLSGLNIAFNAGDQLTFKTTAGSGGGKVVVSAAILL